MRIALTRREALDVPDGINTFLFSLADALLELGHEVTVVSSARANLAKLHDFYSLARWPDIVPLGNHQSVDYRHSLRAWLANGRTVLRAVDPDLIVINGAVPIRFGARTCIVSHDAERRLGAWPVLRTAYKRYCYAKADIVVATCEEVRVALAAELRMSPREIRVIPTCVNLASYRSKPFDQREDAILHMGTVDYKNPLSSIKAFAAMARVSGKLYVTGKPTPEMHELLRGFPAPIREGIELLGYVPAARLFELLGSVKIVSVPSSYAAPVASPTVIEALASGTPVVTSPSISREVVTDGVNGFVRDPADVNAMASAYETLLHDAAAWRRIADLAAASAHTFSARRVAERYLDLV